MPLWLTYATAALKLLGLVDWAESLVKSWQDRRQGAANQKAADNAEIITIKDREDKAVAASPRTVDATIDSMRDGTF